MKTEFLETHRLGLKEQRQNLVDWLAATPAWKKQIRLGPLDEQAVQDHLQVLDETIERAEDQTFGICEVCHEAIEPDRLEMDYACCVCLDHMSAEEKSRLESELLLATEIQQSLLPRQVPEIPRLELAAFSQPGEPF